MRRSALFVLSATALALAACQIKSVTGEKCAASADCLEGLSCDAGVCNARDCSDNSQCSNGDVCIDGLCACNADVSVACATAGLQCGPATLVDQCGGTRSLDCGTCSAGQTCNAGHCICARETDAALCARLGKTCNGLTQVTDACGVTRNVQTCGVCGEGLACSADNTCQCTARNSELCVANQFECGEHVVQACGASRTITCGTCLPGAGACGADGLCATPLCGDDPQMTTAPFLPPNGPFNGNRTIIVGTSMDATVLLVQTVAVVGDCTPRDLGISLGNVASGYAPPTMFGSSMFFNDEEQIALSGDGRSIVGVNPARTGFVTLTVHQQSPLYISRVGGPGPLINFKGTTVNRPVWSGDGLVFIAAIDDKFWESVRGDTADDFPPPHDITADLSVAGVLYQPEGISADGRTLFTTVGGSYTTYVFRRPHRFAPFVQRTPVQGWGYWRAKPSGDCSGTFGTGVINGGGCHNERLSFIPRMIPVR